jgi:phosphoesterase RecJ-like protein
MTTNGSRSARDQVLQELRGAGKLVVVTHENPDGDALGSLIATQGILSAIGKDCLMFIAARELPLPEEYNWFPLDGLVSDPPADVDERTIVFVDCGNVERNPAEAFRRPGMHILNIDHHHDNTRFGTVNLVVPEASCTAEIVWDLMGDLGVTPTLTVAEALYVGLITDTGRFMYENTNPRAHIMAAELIEAGVNVPGVYRRLYEEIPPEKLALLALALAQVQRLDGGALTISVLSAADFARAQAEDTYSEGIIDQLRAVRGTKVAALVRELTVGERKGQHKVSLRATDDDVDVSAIAREQGGGGHRRAAGFSTALALRELVEFLRTAVAAQLQVPSGERAAVTPA